MTYSGLPDKLRQEVFDRDCYRCRWCGVTNASAYDIHHISYRRGSQYDVIDNLITLCREHHGFIHESQKISKQVAQDILYFLISDKGNGLTGLSFWKREEVEVKEGKVGRLL